MVSSLFEQTAFTNMLSYGFNLNEAEVSAAAIKKEIKGSLHDTAAV